MWQPLITIVLTAIACFCMSGIPVIDSAPKRPQTTFNWHHMQPQTKIIGGSDARSVEAPYQVSIRLHGRHFCGGSIYKKRWIITAAHCIRGHRSASITVVVGSTKLDVGGDTYAVQKMFAHKKQDLALLRLKYKIKFSPKIHPVVLANRKIQSGENVVASGWGISDLNLLYSPNDLQIIKLKTVPFTECKNKWSRQKIIDDGSICTLTRSGEGLCMGDSGGPLTTTGNVLVGVVSFGIPCGAGSPDVFAGIFHNKKWIENIVKNNY